MLLSVCCSLGVGSLSGVLRERELGWHNCGGANAGADAKGGRSRRHLAMVRQHRTCELR